MKESIKTNGPAQFAHAEVEVLAFHLHRFVARWLDHAGLEKVWVTVGYEHSVMPPVVVEVSVRDTKIVSPRWSWEGLVTEFHRGTDEIAVEGTDPAYAYPLAEPSADGIPTLLGFAVVGHALAAADRAELEVHLCEGIRASRRNGLRLFFDSCDEADMKGLLYAMLDRVPSWTGCDVASAVILAHSLEAMHAEDAHESEFYVMAERLYIEGDAEESPRLVGMQIDTRDDIRTVIDAAIAMNQTDPEPRVRRFRRTTDGYVDADGERAVSIGSVGGRPDDALSLVVPLVIDGDENELLGFLCLAFTGSEAIPRSVEEVLEDLAVRLADVLRYSPLYTLSARKLRLVRRIRQACEAHVTRESTPDELIEAVVALVRDTADVPAFSIGFLQQSDDRGRTLVFPTSFGWTQFDSIDLPVDVTDDELVDSGVASLAVRLGRGIVLAGGRAMDDHAEFKNYLWVNETTGEICDSRAPACPSVESDPNWVRLGRYYKPARAGAYATVAHPIMFDGEPLGVVALEVDRDTNWYWWTGYGGQLLWELVASELAFAFRILGA